MKKISLALILLLVFNLSLIIACSVSQSVQLSPFLLILAVTANCVFAAVCYAILRFTFKKLNIQSLFGGKNEETSLGFLNRFFFMDLENMVTSIRNFHTSQMEKSEYHETQVLVLVNQINPHFLYNTLESIRGQALYHDDELVADMLETLAMFFRYCISQKGIFVTLRDELNNVNVYLKIMKFRFASRFEFQTIFENDSDIMDYEIPKLTLQPIIENAILHGLQDCTSEGIISLRIQELEDGLNIYIRDNGCGISREALKEINNMLMNPSMHEQPHSRHGIALYNINRRIKLTYGNRYGLHIFSTEGVGTNVAIHIPKKVFSEKEPIYEKNYTTSERPVG